jgi:hypothetical protein
MSVEHEIRTTRVSRFASKAPEQTRKRPDAVFERRDGKLVIVTPGRPNGPPIGSTDLCALSYKDAKNWEGAARIGDVAASITRSTSMLAESVARVLGESLRKIDKEFDALDGKFAALTLENARLQTRLAEIELAVERSRPRASPARRKRAPATAAGSSEAEP